MVTPKHPGSQRGAPRGDAVQGGTGRSRAPDGRRRPSGRLTALGRQALDRAVAADERWDSDDPWADDYQAGDEVGAARGVAAGQRGCGAAQGAGRPTARNGTAGRYLVGDETSVRGRQRRRGVTGQDWPGDLAAGPDSAVGRARGSVVGRARGSVVGRPGGPRDGHPGVRAGRWAGLSRARRRMLERRHRTAALVVLLIAAALVIADLNREGERTRPAGHPTPAATPSAPVLGPAVPTAAPGRPPVRHGAPGVRGVPPVGGVLVPAPGMPTGRVPKVPPGAGAGAVPSPTSAARNESAPAGAVDFPVTGPGTFTYATGMSPVLGGVGTLRRYRVAVENGAGQDAGAFAAEVDAALGDRRRGWTASGKLRLQRVPASWTAQFTVFLATPGTSEKMCAVAGLSTERFTNCRVAGKVIINLARWWRAVPGYGAPLAEYRAYAVNHEFGHELGYGHEACPAVGRLAPVMQQQTLGLRGCRANGWPYVAGRRYAGRGVP